VFSVKVLNVGDGACAIVQAAEDEAVTIIDCGTTSGDAAGAVKDALGLSIANLSTMVVTHFDADHWNGFRNLAPAYAAAIASDPAPKAPTLIYGGMPSGLPHLGPAVLSLISISSGTAVRALDLRTAWRDEGVEINSQILFRNQTFEGSGKTWRVLWPPRRLSSSIYKWIRAAVQEVQVLADDMAAAGHPGLQENLKEAYGLWSRTEPTPIDAEDEDDEGVAEFIAEGFNESEGNDGYDVGEEPNDQPRDRHVGPYGGLSDEHDPQLRERFASISKTLARANNFLSLVVAQDDRFISFGDIQKGALAALLRLEQYRTEINEERPHHYCIALAPHHGSVSIPVGVQRSYPTVCLCVSQSGERLYPHWGKHSLAGKSTGLALSHEAGCCVSTHEQGSITATPHWEFYGCDWHLAWKPRLSLNTDNFPWFPIPYRRVPPGSAIK
jgi:hypothetical protein